MSPQRPAVVVVNYGSSALLAENLVDSTLPGQLVVVVDNWTTAAERGAVQRLADRHGWLVVAPEQNTGFGGGMNLGAARALESGATTLLLLNPDARIDPADAARLIAQVEQDKDLLLAPRIVNPDGSDWMSGIMDLRLADGSVASSRRRPPGADVMEWVSGAVMAISADLWSRIGGFAPEYFLYWEDIDLCRRVHAAGGTVAVDTSVTAVHDEGGTHADGGGRAKSEAYYYYNIRNRSLFASTWLSKQQQRRWARQTPRTAKDVLYKGGRRQFVESFKPWRAYARGVAASYRIALQPPADAGPAPDPGRGITVLESFAEPSALTNPYLIQLRDALAATPGLAVTCWSWRAALLGSYDVFHTHWTEALIETRGSALSTAGRRALFAAFLVRLWATRTPIVRTVHNLDIPSGLSRTELALLRSTDRLTAGRIVLNRFTPVPADDAADLIEHGHYRDWFAQYPRPERVRGRLAFIGKIRRYKNVEGLARAFSGLPDREDLGYSLHVAGKPSSTELADSLRQSAAADPRISLRLDFIDDAELVAEVSESELVVLPYHEMHNSGSVLAALSLDRAVLVPDNAFNEALAEEVGPDWVQMFAGELTADSISAALDRVAAIPDSTRPDLSRRDWADAGQRHLAAFRRAIRRSRRRAPAAEQPAPRRSPAGQAAERQRVDA